MAQIESRESNVILYEETKIPVIVESNILKLHYEKIRNHLLYTILCRYVIESLRSAFHDTATLIAC